MQFFQIKETLTSCGFEQIHQEDAPYVALLSFEEWKEVIDFYKSVGLPTKFEEVAVTDTSDEFLESLAHFIFVSSGNSTREPFEVTPEKIYAALKHIREMDI